MPQEELKRGAHFAEESAPQTPSSEASSSRDDTDDMGSSDYSTVGRSAGLMTILTIVSRVTGFIRTWAMAAAIGMSLLSSSYQVANNLPNMLYELVMGGMLVTAFLPVYMGVRREQGREASNEYVGNLLGILLLVLGGISLLGTVFAPGFIWTQSFLSGDGGSMDTAAFMFRFFAIQILFYGLGSVFSGVLNAHRDYFWSTFAPVLNNVIVIASFMGFAPVSAQFGERAGIILIAAGTTLGVFVQMACQIPALGKHGVHPHIHIDFKDPALRQTIRARYPDAARHGVHVCLDFYHQRCCAGGPARDWSFRHRLCAPVVHAALRADCRLAFDGALYRALSRRTGEGLRQRPHGHFAWRRPDAVLPDSIRAVPDCLRASAQHDLLCRQVR